VRRLSGFALAACGGCSFGFAAEVQGVEYPSVVLDDAPLGYWRLDEPAGATAIADATGNGHAGTIVGAVTFGADGALRGNSCATFDDNEYLQLDDAFGFADGAPFTLELWIDPTVIDTAPRPYLSKGDFIGYTGGYAAFVAVAANPGAPGADFGEFAADRTLTGYVPLVAGRWSYLVLASDGATLRTSVDGVLASVTGVSAWPDVAQPFTISAPSDGPHGGGSFHGSLDEVAVYDRALDADTIAAHFHAGTEASAP
jgi:hypothetical protein